MLKEKLEEIKLELAKEYLKKGKTTPAMKLIKDLIFEISHLKIKEQIEVLNKLLNTNINRKNYEYFFYRYIKPYINSTEENTTENSSKTLSIEKTIKNGANALAREKNRSMGFKSQNNNKKSAVALNPKEKEVKNEVKSNNSSNASIDEIMNEDIDISKYL